MSKSTTEAWAVIRVDKRGDYIRGIAIDRIVKNKPGRGAAQRLRGGEIAIKLKISIPDEVWKDFSPEVSIDVPVSLIEVPEVEVSVEEIPSEDHADPQA